MAQIERHTPLDGRRIADVGGGGGYFTAAFRDRGAHCLLVEPDATELYSNGTPGRASVIGDGYWLPLADASVDVCFSCNVLEHVKDPAGFIDEMIRVTRPGGLVYLSYTVWLSPWGGHETAPFHYLGGHYAARRYARRHGREPKNRYGESMFPVGVGPILNLVRRPDRRHRGRGAAPVLPALVPVPHPAARAPRAADLEPAGHPAAAGVTTLQLPEEEITRHPPGSAGGGQRRLRWLRDGWSDAAERAGRRWAVLVWGLTLAALLAQDPGRMTFDTKLGVNIDPVGFYQRLWHLWNPLEWLGSLQDQYIGYAFPMGVFYLTAHALHVPVWVAERIWMSLLVTVAFLGIVRLAEALGIGTRPTRLLAGATFALWPTFTILIGSTSAAVLPGVLAPWAVLPLIRARSARRPRPGSAPDRGRAWAGSTRRRPWPRWCCPGCTS